MKQLKHSMTQLFVVLAFLCTLVAPVYAADLDLDGVEDTLDNCLGTANRDQYDVDQDGKGNLCDTDLNNDFEIDANDVTLFEEKLRSGDLSADFNASGTVDKMDLVILTKQISLQSPLSPSVGANPQATALAAISAIETVITAIENGKSFSLADEKTIDNLLFTIAANMREATTGAFNSVQKKNGGVKGLGSVETTLTKLRPRLEKNIVRMQVIESRLLAGEYLFDKSYIEAMNDEERSSLLSQMPTSARDALLAQFPDLFTQPLPTTTDTNIRPISFVAPQLELGVKKVTSQMLDFLIPPTEAAAALTCWTICKPNVWSQACLTCIQQQGPKVQQAWKDFLSCWKNAHKPLWITRPWCVLKLLAVLA